MPKGDGSPSVVPGPAALISPGSLKNANSPVPAQTY